MKDRTVKFVQCVGYTCGRRRISGGDEGKGIHQWAPYTYKNRTMKSFAVAISLMERGVEVT
jgi:hypothetical protein